jgi:hypothetical protein
MPGNDHPKGQPAPAAAENPELRQVSRRSLLGAAGVGAAGLAAGAFGGLSAVQAATGKPAGTKPVPAKPAAAQSEPDETGDSEHIVVHVRPGRSGELDVFHGTNQVTVHDADLAARLRQVTR